MNIEELKKINAKAFKLSDGKYIDFTKLNETNINQVTNVYTDNSVHSIINISTEVLENINKMDNPYFVVYENSIKFVDLNINKTKDIEKIAFNDEKQIKQALNRRLLKIVPFNEDILSYKKILGVFVEAPRIMTKDFMFFRYPRLSKSELYNNELIYLDKEESIAIEE